MTWTLCLAALAPLAYLAAALAPERGLPIAKSSQAAAWLALGAAAAGLWRVLALGPAARLAGSGGLGLAVRLDALSAVVCGLIAFIGLVVVAYSRNYLAGDPRRGRFMRTLCLTLALVQGLVLAGDLAQLALCWIGASLCVNRLLLFRGERPAAVLAARKRFLASRLAEACLIGAAVLLWRAAGSGDVGAILAAAKAGRAPEWQAAGMLLALAALFSSAQPPFHGWILEVMETPTPVSALLHAGVVNAGGFLVLRFGAVMSADPAAMVLLVAVGAAGAIMGALVMLTQTSVKSALAYSTIAQMGFMLLECGLGAFSAALLHIVAHALYKAHAFLSAGSVGAPKPATGLRSARPGWRRRAAVLLVLAGLGWATASACGAGPAQQPGVFVLGAVLLLGLARLWTQAQGPAGLLGAGAATVALMAAYAAGQGLFACLVGPLGAQGGPPGGPEVVAAIGVVAAMTALAGLQLGLPGPPGSPAWARAYGLVSNGFHLNTWANRWVLRLWPSLPGTIASPPTMASPGHGAA